MFVNKKTDGMEFCKNWIWKISSLCTFFSWFPLLLYSGKNLVWREQLQWANCFTQWVTDGLDSLDVEFDSRRGGGGGGGFALPTIEFRNRSGLTQLLLFEICFVLGKNSFCSIKTFYNSLCLLSWILWFLLHNNPDYDRIDQGLYTVRKVIQISAI